MEIRVKPHKTALGWGVGFLVCIIMFTKVLACISMLTNCLAYYVESVYSDCIHGVGSYHCVDPDLVYIRLGFYEGLELKSLLTASPDNWSRADCWFEVCQEWVLKLTLYFFANPLYKRYR